jgi:hypothetical protein
MPTIDELREQLASRSPGESISFSAEEMPELPAGFKPTVWGTPLWIAHPGATAQSRAYPALHAYKLSGRSEIHRDQFDPHDHPVLHILFDAPEIALAALASAIAGLLAYLFFERREKQKPKGERRSWLPAIAAFVVALVIGLIAYVLGAKVRVALGVG